MPTSSLIRCAQRLMFALVVAGLVVTASPADETAAVPLDATQQGPPAGSADPAGERKPAATGRLVKNGVIVEFEALPPEGSRRSELMEGQMAELRFRITEEATGQPVKGITPGAWMDIGEAMPAAAGGEQKPCKEKIALYLKGVVGIRPMIDLNSYYVLVLNKEPSISVVDPLVSMVGQTSTLASVPLEGVGADWVRSADEKRVYVSLPTVGKVALLETDRFKVTANIEAGAEPTRVALQPDGRYLWVGNNAPAAELSGVTVIDTETLVPVARIPTGSGHHEIAFTDDSRYAFVSNRQSGTVTVIDVQSKAKVKDIATGPVPISLAYASLAKALYVADGREGTITALDAERFEVVGRITVQPGLGPLGVTPDGRWVLIVNPAEDAIYVIDAASNELAHTLEVPGQPYQIAFSRAFAYVRSLGSEKVSMINLASLDGAKEPIVTSFAAGELAPKLAGDLPLADSIASTSSEAAVFVVNPADNTTYFYMEGMNAPSSNYKVYGARARAVTVVDRSLKELEPGLYTSTVKIPAAGRYDVSFLLETPRLLHCFSAEAKPNPLIKHDLAALGVKYLNQDRRAIAGKPVALRFRLVDPATGQPKTGLKDVRVRYFRVPGSDRTEVFAKDEGGGVYRAMLPLPRAGAYYVHVGVPSEKVGYADLPYFILVATKDPAAIKPGKPATETEG